MTNFKYHNKAGECPVCGEYHSKKVCRTQTFADGTELHFCWRGENAPPEYKSLGFTDFGAEKFILRRENDRQDSWQDRILRRVTKAKRKAKATADAKALDAARTTNKQRDHFYRSIQGQQPLSDHHREQLRERGLSDAQIDEAIADGTYRTSTQGQRFDVTPDGPIPGIGRNGKWTGCDGLAIAVRGVDGNIVGFQVKPDEGGGYRWVTAKIGKETDGHVKGFDEQPITIIQNPNYHGAKELWIVEGVLKPDIVARLAWDAGRPDVAVLGCGGSNWASSPKLLKQALAAIAPTAVHILPDAGAFISKLKNGKPNNVRTQHKKLLKLLKNEGYPPLYRWWGQWSKDGKGAMDPDEIPMDTLMASPLLRRFPGSMGFSRDRVEPAKVARKNPEVNTAKDLLQRWTESTKRFVCDGSPTSTGKNYSAGMARPEMFTLSDGTQAKGIWLITDDARNPSTPTLLAAPWVTIEGRHAGLVLEKDVDGTTIKRRMKAGDEKWDIQPNCSRNGISGALRAKNIDGDSSQEVLCRACPKFNLCANSGGMGYGFLYARYAAMRMPQKLINPNSLPSPDGLPLSQDVAIVDEFGAKTLTNELSITKEDIDQAIAILASKHPEQWEKIRPLTQALQELTDADDLGYHGLSHHPAVERLRGIFAGIDEQTILAVETALQPDLVALTEVAEGVKLADLPPQLKKTFSYTDHDAAEKIQKEPKQWLGDLWRIVTERSLGMLITNRWGKLTIHTPNDQMLKFLRQCGKIIILDATLPVEHLAAWLGIPVDDIDFVATPPSPSPVKGVQIKGLGRCTRNRSESQQARIERAIAAIKRRHPGLTDDEIAVIDFKGSDFADAVWWRDTRGSNAFKNIRVVIAIGTPIANLNGMAAQYMAIYGAVPDLDSPEYQQFAQETLTATFTQTMGRKAGRRGQDGDVMYFITEEDGLEAIAQSLGMDFATIEAAALGDGIGDQGSQTRVAIAQGLHKGHDREGCANAAGVTGGRVSQVVPNLGFGEGFKDSSKKLAGFNSDLIKGTNFLDSEARETAQTLMTYGIDPFKDNLRRWLAEIQTTLKPLPDPILEHLRQEIDAWGCGMAFGAAPSPQELLDLFQKHGESAFREAISAISKYGRAGLESAIA